MTHQATGHDGSLQIPLDPEYLDSAANQQALAGGFTMGLLDQEEDEDASSNLARRRSNTVATVPIALASRTTEETTGPSAS